MVILNNEEPQNCNTCDFRHVVKDGDKIYQMCGICSEDYKSEAWFNSEDLKKDKNFRAVECPIMSNKGWDTFYYVRNNKAGLWFYKTGGDELLPHCSCCKQSHGTKFEFKCCPNCGAEMEP